jgi:dipeptide/tripeptide permease
MMLAYAAINVGAILAPLTIGPLATRSGFGVAFALATGIAGVAAVFSVGLAVADSRLASGPAPSAPLSVLGVAAVGALFTLPYLTNTAGSEGLHSGLSMLAPENTRFLLSLNPWIVLGTVGLFVVLLLVLHASRRRLPALRLLGGGAVLATLSTVPLLRYGMELEGLVAGLVLGAVAEVLIFPVALSRVSGVASPRIAALLVGFFLSWVGLLNHGVNAMGLSDGAGVFLWLLAFASLGIGGVLLVLGGKLERRLFAPAPPPTSPAPGVSLAP